MQAKARVPVNMTFDLVSLTFACDLLFEDEIHGNAASGGESVISNLHNLNFVSDLSPVKLSVFQAVEGNLYLWA